MSAVYGPMEGKEVVRFFWGMHGIRGGKIAFYNAFSFCLLPPLVYQDSEDGRNGRETFFVPVS